MMKASNRHVQYENSRDRVKNKRGQKSVKKSRDWILEKKERRRKQGKDVRPDSKFTGRKRSGKLFWIIKRKLLLRWTWNWHEYTQSKQTIVFILPYRILLDSSIFRYLRSRQARCLAWAVEQSYINRFIYSRYKRYTYSHLLFNSWRKAAIGFNCKDYPRGKQLGLQTPRSVCTRTHQRRKSPLEDDRQAEQHSTYLWQHSRVCSPCAQNRCNVPSHCIPSRNLLPPMINW